MMRSQAATLARALLSRAPAPKTYLTLRPPTPRVKQVTSASLYKSSWLLHSTVKAPVKKSEAESLSERGLLNDIVLRHAKAPHTKSITIADCGKYVNIEWEDGHISSFYSMWLRHNCHCPACRLDHNGMMSTKPDDFDVNIRVISADLQDGQILMLKWQYSDSDRTHEGPIPLSFMRLNCNSPLKKEESSKALAMPVFKDKIIPEVEYDDIMDPSNQGLYKWLCNLEERGICLLKNCPQEKGVVGKVAERIAPLQHTVYGEIFDVYSQPQPINAAYSPVELALHMDQPMYENPPGLQLLHCIKFDSDVVGGENTFADIFELANQLRKERPDYFDTLVRVPVTMQTIHYDRDYPVHMSSKRPLFGLNDRGELITVLWHPMLTTIHPNHADIEPFYEAYKYFFHMVQDCQSKYAIRMVAGDMITFNNRRVLHGRNSYQNAKGERWLQGTYVELTEFRSRLQVFHNILGDGRHAKRVGCHDWQ